MKRELFFYEFKRAFFPTLIAVFTAFAVFLPVQWTTDFVADQFIGIYDRRVNGLNGLLLHLFRGGLTGHEEVVSFLYNSQTGQAAEIEIGGDIGGVPLRGRWTDLLYLDDRGNQTYRARFPNRTLHRSEDGREQQVWPAGS